MAFEVPSDFRKFQEVFEKITYKHDPIRVFNDFLDFIIRGFSLDNSMKWDKNYDKKEIILFNDLFAEFVKIQNKKIVTDKDWFDFFGTYYESVIITNYNKKGTGQFFTPPELCKLMDEVTITELNGKKAVNDCSCGSGRNLLASYTRNPGITCFGEDLDLTCVKMTICNFLVHGVHGQVTWMDSLTREFFGAWMVNDMMFLTLGAPHVRKMSESEYYIRNMNFEVEIGPVKDMGPVTLDSFVEAAK